MVDNSIISYLETLSAKWGSMTEEERFVMAKEMAGTKNM